MWDTVDAQPNPKSHEMPCPECGHPSHTYLPCSDDCDCVPSWLPHEESPRTARARDRKGAA